MLVAAGRGYGEIGRPVRFFEGFREWVNDPQGGQEVRESGSTSDFATYLSTLIYKVFWDRYQRAESNWREWAGIMSVSDYKEITSVSLSGFPRLLKVREGGEFKDAEISEMVGPKIKVEKFGRLFSLTREAIINDDLTRFRDLPSSMAEAAATSIAIDVVQTGLEANPVAYDGTAFFHVNHGNLITDAFTTEIGGEVYLRTHGFLGMASVTGGEVKGSVETPQARSPAYIGKLGYDKQLTQDVRFRLTGSVYKKDRSASNTLFTGDRGGSRYFDVLENTTSTVTANAWSGEVRPGFSSRVTSFVVNPFVKVQGIEVFGNIETATGKTATEPGYRTWRQLAGEGIYRFADDKLYAGYRYNTVAGSLLGIQNDVNANRYQIGGGWFINPMMLFKLEYVNQKYYGFPVSDIRRGGQFKGFMVESTLAF